ncbi:MAG TPA: hypothetical protein VLT36_07900 [Candidatus Dormibacteraeota bacterium]|nr:hypothetical protein [Candidatus Dormibacteraeota bacterium]
MKSKAAEEPILAEVVIQRPSSAGVEPSEKKKDEPDQWYVIFRFSIAGEPTFRSVVELLDGSYAVEESATGEQSPVSENAPRARSERSAQDQKGRQDPYQLVHSATFDIPSVQWNPLSGKLPLQLHATVSNAREYLMQTHTNKTQPQLDLTLIKLSPYTPTAAVAARGGNPLDHLHHWLVEVDFEQQAEARMPAEKVFMLLDGRVLSLR